MKMKKTLIVANWKMNLNIHQSSLLVSRLNKKITSHQDIEVVLSPSMLALQPIHLELNHHKFRLASQNGYFPDEGPYTGEVSFAMLKGLVDYGIIGHSSRRIYFNETLEMIRDKVKAAIRNDIIPIICIGETKPERLAGETNQVLHDQLTTAIYHLTSEEIARTVIAYEPIWAISTFDGEPSKPDDMQKALKFIRDQITDLYGQNTADDVRILYGGSVDDHDVRAYLSLEDCDGVLVGAASLNYEKFSNIVSKANQLNREIKN